MRMSDEYFFEVAILLLDKASNICQENIMIFFASVDQKSSFSCSNCKTIRATKYSRVQILSRYQENRPFIIQLKIMFIRAPKLLLEFHLHLIRGPQNIKLSSKWIISFFKGFSYICVFYSNFLGFNFIFFWNFTINIT